MAVHALAGSTMQQRNHGSRRKCELEKNHHHRIGSCSASPEAFEFGLSIVDRLLD
jgi:hypothetical protein